MSHDDPLNKRIHNPLDIDLRPGLDAVRSTGPRWLDQLAQRAFLWMLTGLRIGALRVTTPDGQVHAYAGTEPGPSGHIILNRPWAMLRKTIAGAATGFGESYLDRDWDDDGETLTGTLQVMMVNQPHFKGPYDRNPLSRGMGRALHSLRRNTKSGARKNIQAHYDLGNDFYTRWLDQATMSYSSAVFDEARMATQPLDQAQLRKFEHMLDRLDLRAEHHLLEIGSGWGGFAIFAAQQTGCRVTSITLSDEQLAWAREAARQAGVGDQIEFRIQDYRDVAEQFDRVVSIEMYEAVGEAYWGAYFKTIERVLKPGGVAAIQGITINAAEFEAYRGRIDFIQKYIFPGGMLATPERFDTEARDAGLAPESAAFFGKHYAETLRRWHTAILPERKAIAAKYDGRFYRMWRYYLSYCECGFEDGRIDLMQTTLRKPG